MDDPQNDTENAPPTQSQTPAVVPTEMPPPAFTAPSCVPAPPPSSFHVLESIRRSIDSMEEFSTPKGSPSFDEAALAPMPAPAPAPPAGTPPPATRTLGEDLDLTPLTIREGEPTPENLTKRASREPTGPVPFFTLRPAASPLAPAAAARNPLQPCDDTMLGDDHESESDHPHVPSYLDVTLDMQSPAAPRPAPASPPRSLFIQLPSEAGPAAAAAAGFTRSVTPVTSTTPSTAMPSPIFDDAFMNETQALVSHLRAAGPNDAELTYLRNEVQVVRRERDELIRLCHEHEASLGQLRDRESRLHVEAEAKARLLEGSLRQGEERYTALLQSFEELTTRYGEVKKKYQAALSNEAKVKEALDDFEARAGAAYNDLSIEYQSAQNRLVEALADNATLRQQLEARASEVHSVLRGQEEMRQTIAERTAHAEQYRMLNESLRVQLDTTSQQLSQANLARQQQAMEFEGARVQLQEAHRAVRGYQEQLERGAKENADLVAMCQTLMAKLESQKAGAYGMQ